MERRLCYQHGAPELNNAPGAAPAAEPSAREKAEYTARRKLLGLENKTDEQLIEEALKAVPHDPVKREEWLHMRLTTLNERTRGLATTFAVELQEAKQGIGATLVGKARTDMMDIISALQKPLPAKNGISHRYGNTDAGVNFIRIETDQRYIRSLIPAFPQAAAYLQRIDGALTQLKRQDIRYEVRDIELRNQKENQKIDKFMGNLGNLSGTLILVAGALLTGIPAIMHSWKNKKIEMQHFTPALLYAAVATVVASPSLRRQLFSSKEQSTLTDIDATLNNPQFRKHCEDYHLHGPAAAGVVRKMMEQPGETRTITAKLKAKGQGTSGLEKDITAYINGMTSNPQLRTELHRMFQDRRFSDLPHMLSFAKTPEAQGVILDYVRIGSGTYDQQVQRAAAQMNQPE